MGFRYRHTTSYQYVNLFLLVTGWNQRIFPDWWKHKTQNTWILPALIKSCSKMNPDNWDRTPPTTNLGKAQHHWTNVNSLFTFVQWCWALPSQGNIIVIPSHSTNMDSIWPHTPGLGSAMNEQLQKFRVLMQQVSLRTTATMHIPGCHETLHVSTPANESRRLHLNARRKPMKSKMKSLCSQKVIKKPVIDSKPSRPSKAISVNASHLPRLSQTRVAVCALQPPRWWRRARQLKLLWLQKLVPKSTTPFFHLCFTLFFCWRWHITAAAVKLTKDLSLNGSLTANQTAASPTPVAGPLDSEIVFPLGPRGDDTMEMDSVNGGFRTSGAYWLL